MGDNMKLKIKRLTETAILPRYALPSDAGMDIFSDEDVIIQPKARGFVKTGIAMEFEPGYVALIWDKSGLALKKGIKTMAGVIEHTYRGEIGIVLYNTGEEPLEIKRGDKVAQMLFQPIISAEVEEVEELTESIRGEGGFGSTGDR